MSPAVRPGGWASLERALGGALLRPSSAGFDAAHRAFVARVDRVVPAVARCARPEQVAAVIAFARDRGLEIAVRCGGYSSTRGIVVAVTPMASVTVADGVVEVGAGIRSGALIERLYREGVAIPAGTCPSVGIAGLTLGGGIGILGRAHGLTPQRRRRGHEVSAPLRGDASRRDGGRGRRPSHLLHSVRHA